MKLYEVDHEVNHEVHYVVDYVVDHECEGEGKRKGSEGAGYIRSHDAIVATPNQCRPVHTVAEPIHRAPSWGSVWPSGLTYRPAISIC